MDDIDFKARVNRAEFETLCADLFERVPGPVQQALAASEMSMVFLCITFFVVRVWYLNEVVNGVKLVVQDEIEQVILVGGSTRVPKVQEVLSKAVGRWVLCPSSTGLQHAHNITVKFQNN